MHSSLPFFRNKLKCLIAVRIHRHCRQYTRNFTDTIVLEYSFFAYICIIIILKTCLYFLLLDYDRRNASLSVTDKPDTTLWLSLFSSIYLFSLFYALFSVCAIFIHKVLSKIYILLILWLEIFISMLKVQCNQ